VGLFDKVKNLFTEEVEVETEEKAPIKKEVIQVEIPSPAKTTRSELHAHEEDIVTEQKPKEEYKFPFFDDEDFEEINEKREEKIEKKKPLYRNREAAYNPTKEEKHAFKPTPIISPVYGILDKNYVKEDIKAKNIKPSSYYNPKEATIDDIRNKAYGTLEDDVANELYEADRALYEPVDEPELEFGIEEKIETKTDDLFEEIERDVPVIPEEEEPLARHAKVSGKNDELTSLLEEEMSKEATDDLPKDEPAKISDKELFNLIDSMYERGDK